MNYKISQRGHAALEQNIKRVFIYDFKLIVFFHPVIGNIAGITLSVPTACGTASMIAMALWNDWRGP